MKSNVIAFESISAAVPLSRVKKSKDTRYIPSYVDVGTLQMRACQLSARWRLRGSEPFPDRYLAQVREMITDSVRGVGSVSFTRLISGDQSLVFLAEDDMGPYSYGFVLQESWFRKN